MRIVVFGLTVTSSWGNGHATLWRALIGALGARGHHVTFFERDVPYYAAHRDLTGFDAHTLVLYDDWDTTAAAARTCVRSADAAIVTSYCPDAQAAADLVCSSTAAAQIFYDLDTPMTLAALRQGKQVEYLPCGGLGDFNLVLSFGGGPSLVELRDRLGARRVAPLYGSVDPHAYRRTADVDEYRADVAYLGTYSHDRQAALDTLFLEPARRRPALRFLLGGSLYPANFPWMPNVYYIPHVPPFEHPRFYSSCRITVNVTRGPMAEMGFCPSGRLFEAAACGTPVLSDTWPGLDAFFEPGREILTAGTAEEAIDALDRSPAELAAIGARARARTLECHSADRRAEELEHLLENL
jgi:spore maturation protein CgeB